MEGDKLLKVNQALNTIAEIQNSDRSNIVIEQVERARALPYDEQLKLYEEVGADITRKVAEIFEQHPNGEVDCSLGSYKVDIDESSVIVNHRQRLDFSERAFAEGEGVTEATEGELGIVELVPRVSPWREEKRIESSWYALFDAQETIDALRRAVSAE